MNLKSFVDETALADFDWLKNPKTYTPKDKDINKKDDLEIEWGVGSGIDIGITPAPTTIKDEMDLHSELGLAKYARHLMMQGLVPKQIMSGLIARFGKDLVRDAIPELKALFANAGIIGCVAVDSRDYKTCQQAVKVASKSPFKRHIRFALMNEGCANCVYFNCQSCNKGSVRFASTDSVDNFLGLKDAEVDTERPFCSLLNLPVITKHDDVTEDQAKSLLAEMVMREEIDQSDATEILDGDATPYQMIRLAFFTLMEKAEKAERGKYGQDVDVTDFQEMKREYAKDIEIDEPYQAVISDVSEIEGSPGQSDDVGLLDMEKDAVDIKAEELKAEYPDALDTGAPSETMVADVSEVEGVNAVYTQDIEFGEGLDEIEVETDTYTEPEFEGIDEIDVEDEKEPEEELDVNMTPDMLV
jgi:hypothetical protein